MNLSVNNIGKIDKVQRKEQKLSTESPVSQEIVQYSPVPLAHPNKYLVNFKGAVKELEKPKTLPFTKQRLNAFHNALDKLKMQEVKEELLPKINEKNFEILEIMANTQNPNGKFAYDIADLNLLAPKINKDNKNTLLKFLEMREPDEKIRFNGYSLKEMAPYINSDNADVLIKIAELKKPDDSYTYGSYDIKDLAPLITKENKAEALEKAEMIDCDGYYAYNPQELIDYLKPAKKQPQAEIAIRAKAENMNKLFNHYKNEDFMSFQDEVRIQHPRLQTFNEKRNFLINMIEKSNMNNKDCIYRLKNSLNEGNIDVIKAMTLKQKPDGSFLYDVYDLNDVSKNITPKNKDVVLKLINDREMDEIYLYRLSLSTLSDESIEHLNKIISNKSLSNEDISAIMKESKFNPTRNFNEILTQQLKAAEIKNSFKKNLGIEISNLNASITDFAILNKFNDLFYEKLLMYKELGRLRDEEITKQNGGISPKTPSMTMPDKIIFCNEGYDAVNNTVPAHCYYEKIGDKVTTKIYMDYNSFNEELFDKYFKGTKYKNIDNFIEHNFFHEFTHSRHYKKDCDKAIALETKDYTIFLNKEEQETYKNFQNSYEKHFKEMETSLSKYHLDADDFELTDLNITYIRSNLNLLNKSIQEYPDAFPQEFTNNFNYEKLYDISKKLKNAKRSISDNLREYANKNFVEAVAVAGEVEYVNNTYGNKEGAYELPNNYLNLNLRKTLEVLNYPETLHMSYLPEDHPVIKQIKINKEMEYEKQLNDLNK